MIVVDTHVISHLFIPGEWTQLAEAAYQRDPALSAPFLWRSEFRNVLAGCMRRGQLSQETALRAAEEAGKLLRGREYMIPSDRVLELVGRSTCSAYDCEFVALAEDLHVPLITMDQEILREFPKIAVSLKKFAGSR